MVKAHTDFRELMFLFIVTRYSPGGVTVVSVMFASVPYRNVTVRHFATSRDLRHQVDFSSSLALSDNSLYRQPPPHPFVFTWLDLSAYAQWRVTCRSDNSQIYLTDYCGGFIYIYNIICTILRRSHVDIVLTSCHTTIY